MVMMTAMKKLIKNTLKKLQDEFDYENAYGYILNHFSVVMNEPECDLPVKEKGDLAIYLFMSYQDHLVKGDVFLTDTERKAIKTLARGFKKFLLVLNTMGPVDLSGLDELNLLQVKSIHLVNLLLHDLKKYDDYIANFGNVTDTNYLEGIYVADVDVLFPFGYGLGYTDFKIKYNKLMLMLILKNIGKFKGRKDNVKLEFKLSDFASYDGKSQSYILEAGSYIVRFGNSSRNTIPCAVIELPSRVIIIEDMTFHSKKKRDNLNGLLIMITPYEIDETIKSLFVQNQTVVMPDIIAGSAGEFYKFRDLKPIILSDGPAGLSIIRDYFIDENGNAQSTSGKFPDSTLEIIPDDAKPSLSFLFLNIPEGVKFHHQYTTAIPIATAYAQSWNIEICSKD
ncbi:hypothetical protein U3516DRAFT_748753 [Neocallimastix sp. 'constans']